MLPVVSYWDIKSDGELKFRETRELRKKLRLCPPYKTPTLRFKLETAVVVVYVLAN